MPHWQLTFLKVFAEIVHLSANSRYKNVSHLFFESVVAGHDKDHQSLVGRRRGAENWACNEMRMGVRRDNVIQFA